MTRFFPKSCQHCGGDLQFIPAFASEPDDRFKCFQCSRASCREPKDAAKLRALHPRYSQMLDRRKVVSA